ncbi:mannose-1-phosphate guanylyltransferase/mannose-6-phosphate isomerase [Pseudorhodobacter sp.]|uniref:mannose-1-phosphate guanylyltransferase/mannose-6-phosphate isomerase n=1 Tax=Pseudorhodobacter sp. TaxID=1934400 RepID=UPI002647E36C|nr:mannose-1-phosphate guanylyltransferase/mannose-6-phosphate isomerase [Pseudorhodobacter sp.]MDN5788330.1 mannose-1-phosphate guanylyltransferase/mannose-6-phosphate isomerase [Pseudorhodobacter sp.]
MIHPLILCGGSGTRLWPLSRRSHPKQFATLTGKDSLLQETAFRLSDADFAAPTIITAADYRFVVAEQITAAGIDPGAILIEPEPRNTGPAVLAAALYLAKTDPEAVMLVAPSDHRIPDAQGFRAAVRAGLETVRTGGIVTFGITPEWAETGYGYLEAAASVAVGQVAPVLRFVEKPDAARASEMLAQGNYLWNGGLFLFKASTIIEAFRRHAPDLVDPVTQSVDAARSDLGFLRLEPTAWARARSVSIDYAVMERAKNISVVAIAAGWSDLGDWNAVWQALEPDADGMATRGPVTAIDCRDTLLRSEDDRLQLVGLGLENIIAIAMPDAVLIADRRQAQRIKEVVPALMAKGAAQAVQLPRDFRPWGWFDSLIIGGRFQVKRIVVKPGAVLSLQSHMHRSEHWIVVEGTARITIGDRVELISENQSVFVPLGARHRMENPGKTPMVLIEVQTGSYLGEDDIIRYEDVYARDAP